MPRMNVVGARERATFGGLVRTRAGSPRSTRSLFAWGLVALLVAKCAATYPLSLMARFPDEGIYLAIGTSLAEGHGYAILGHPTMIVVPGYPLLVGLCLALFGTGSRLPLYVVQACLTMVLAVTYGRLVVGLGARKWLGQLTTVVVFVFPPFIQYTGLALTEVLYSTWVALTCLAYCHVCREPHAWRSWAWLGLWHTLGFMTRPVTFLLTPLLVLLPVVSARRGWRRAVAAATLSVAVMLAVWLPWVVRNATVSGHFVPLSTYGGVTLLAASLEEPQTYARHYEKVLADARLRFFDDEYRADQLLRQDGRQRIFQDPGAYLERVLLTNWHFWLWEYPQYFGLSMRFRECVRDGRLVALSVKLLLVALNILLPIALAGSAWILRRRRDCWPYFGLIVYFWGVHAFLYPINRYSVPIVGLALSLIILAASMLFGGAGDGRAASPRSSAEDRPC